MPQKICPACQKASGPRTKKCVCGHVFINDTDKPVENSLTNKENVKKLVVTPIVQAEPKNFRSMHSGLVIAPAGECPIKPKGFKHGWPDGSASDEVIQNWALDIFNYAEGRFSTEAVVYWARNFWDINGEKFPHVRNTIFQTLSPNKRTDLELDEILVENN